MTSNDYDIYDCQNYVGYQSNLDRLQCLDKGLQLEVVGHRSVRGGGTKPNLLQISMFQLAFVVSTYEPSGFILAPHLIAVGAACWRSETNPEPLPHRS